MDLPSIGLSKVEARMLMRRECGASQFAQVRRRHATLIILNSCFWSDTETNGMNRCHERMELEERVIELRLTMQTESSIPKLAIADYRVLPHSALALRPV